MGNGDPSCHEPDVFVAKSSVRTADIKDWRWQRIANPYQSDLPETAVAFDDAGWTPHNVQAAAGPLAEREHAVFRARCDVKPDDLKAEAVELGFGNISGDGWVFVNGRKVGESHDSRVAPVFDVKSALHSGENTVAVVVANYGNAGGVSKGAALQFQDPAELPQWQRSVFNGLAQIIVQSSKVPGQLKLTARSADLQPATATIRTQTCPLRPSVP